MDVEEKQLEALQELAARDGIPVEMLVARLVIEEALRMIDEASKPKATLSQNSAVVLPFRRKISGPL